MQIGVCLLPAAARFNYFYYTFFMLGPELTSRKCSASDSFFFFKGWEKFLNVVSIQVEFCKLICPPVPTGVGSFLVCLERKCQAPVVAPTFCHGSKINIKWQNRGRGFHNNCFAPAGWACVVSVRGVGLMPVGHYHFGEQCCQDEQKSSLDVCLPGQLWLMFLKR